MSGASTAAAVSGMRDRRLVPVSELFYSFQGEGPSAGRRALFARFMGCNLTCGYTRQPGSADEPADGLMVCDTDYTWNRARHDLDAGSEPMTPDQVWEQLLALDPASSSPNLAPVDLIVVSGGEPLLYQDAVARLARAAAATGRTLEVETNATIVPRRDLIQARARFNAGLKLASSAVPRPRRVKPKAIEALRDTGRARWKFVVTGLADLAEVQQLQREYGLSEIWLSPEGTTAAVVLERLRLCAQAALEHGWNLTTRQHVLIWGDTRGR